MGIKENFDFILLDIFYGSYLIIEAISAFSFVTNLIAMGIELSLTTVAKFITRHISQRDR